MMMIIKKRDICEQTKKTGMCLSLDKAATDFLKVFGKRETVSRLFMARMNVVFEPLRALEHLFILFIQSSVHFNCLRTSLFISDGAGTLFKHK